jgi:hypothetical protein
MFVFKPTTKTYSDPVSATFIPGIPFGREYCRGDICLLHEGFAASKMFLNSKVLREAILNSKEYLEEVLDLKITDKLATKNEETIKQIKKPKKNAKEVEVFIAEDLPVKEELPTDQTGEEVTEVESTTEPVVEEKE